MATGSVISIANRSLGSIGAQAQIQNLDEGSTESNAVNLFYQSTFEALARAARWGCLKKQGQLTLVAAAPGTPVNPQGATTPYPPNPWLYSYAVPSDSLFIRQLVPPRPTLQNSGAVPIFPTNNFLGQNCDARRQIPYELGYGADKNGNAIEVINTNLGGALAIYTVNQPNPQFWDSLLQQAMVSSLSVFLSASVSGDKALVQMQRAAAESMIMQARTMDGNENPVSQDHVPDWMAARNGESGPWGTGYNGPFFNYDMPWPVVG